MNIEALKKMLTEAAKEPDEKIAAFAAKLLAMLNGEEDQEGGKPPAAPDTKRELPADEADEEDDGDDAPKAKPAKASALLASLAEANKRATDEERERRKQRRADILATLPKAVALSLATERLEVVERVAAKLGPRAPLDLASRMAGDAQPAVLASAPRGAADPSQPRPPRLPPAENLALRKRMGLVDEKPGVQRLGKHGEILVMGMMPSDVPSSQGKVIR